MPVRAGRFIARKNWIVCGSDDFQLRVHNYNTSEKITSFEAHPDYIRAIAVHPSQPFVLTASDDMTIKLWDWDKGWKCVQVFEGHSHYVMGLAINPKDTNTFASACLDRTVKIWSLGSSTPNFTLEAHDFKGVNHVDYYPLSDKPYLLTTSDDKTVKVWDYTTKGLIATLEGHTSNVSFACYHPELPVIISGSEDGTIKIWHANTFRLEQSLNYGLERAWCVSYQRGRQGIAVGFDDGAVVVKMGREEPAVSMDAGGKVIWARHTDILTTQIKGADKSLRDGDKLTLPAKELGTTDLYPQSLIHSPNGRFVAVCGDGEFIIYTSLALRNQAFGSALDFAWGSKENDKDYAIRESTTSVKIFRNLKEKGPLNVGFQAEGLAGGVLLGVKGQGGIGLFDWESGALVRRIEVEPRNVYWSESGELVTLACEDTFYVLRFSRDAWVEAVQNGEADEDGVEAAFEVVADVNESVRTGQWVGDCFVYTNSTNRLSKSHVSLRSPTWQQGLVANVQQITSSATRPTPLRTLTARRTCWAISHETRACISAIRTSRSSRMRCRSALPSTRRLFSAETSRRPTSCCPKSRRTSSIRLPASSRARAIGSKRSRLPPTPSIASSSR